MTGDVTPLTGDVASLTGGWTLNTHTTTLSPFIPFGPNGTNVIHDPPRSLMDLTSGWWGKREIVTICAKAYGLNCILHEKLQM